ncbi:MAG TPA: tail fiber domain-containing protein, partial [Blastocatellia bacterium]|nr:tail fiber domain-containing protein [Blastocatellia bacterium]
MLKTVVATRAALACLKIALLLVVNTIAFGQGTAFTYQGRLTDSGNVANGTYDMQFKLFDTSTVGTGTPQGSTLLLTNIAVTAGLFTVQLDFGVCPSCFNGEARFLEIAVKPTGGSTFTTLGPRQPVTPTPYAIKSQKATTADNATQLGGQPASGFIQNTTTQQVATDFNISGSGTVGGTLTGGVVTATTQYDIAGQRVLSIPGTGNLFAGVNAGSSNTTGVSNSYFGRDAGSLNTAGSSNSFFGREAGVFTQGDNNSFFGRASGFSNTGGTANTLIGANANVGANSLINSTAIGYRASVNQSNSLVLGGISGVNSCNAGNNCDSVNVGIGTTTPAERLHVAGNGLFTGTLSGNVVSATTHFNLAGVRMLAANGPFDSGLGLNLSASNAFLGESAGLNTAPNPTLTSGEGKNNSFVGAAAGEDNTTGSSNSFFGVLAGAANTTGIGNSFFGVQAGVGNSIGSNNTAIGLFANVGSNNLTNATAVGARARVDQSNSLVLGSISGVNGATADTNVGIGTTAPINLLTVGQPEATEVTGRVGIFSPSGLNLVLRDTTNDVEGIIGANSSSGVIYGSMTNHAVHIRTHNINRITIVPDGNVGIGDTTPVDKLDVEGDIRVGTGTTGCVKDADGTGIAGTCSSDARLKSGITPFPRLLDKLSQLQPVHFYWRTDQFPNRNFGSSQSFGLVAQDVEKVMPELVTEDDSGYKLVRYHKL